MMNKLVAGDYVPRGSGVARLFGPEALLGQVLFRLQCRRGSFPFLPELGSQLWRLGREKPADRAALARQYAVQALQPLPVTVTDVTVTEQAAGLQVHVELQAAQETMQAEVLI